MQQSLYYCPSCNDALVLDAGDGLRCKQGHQVPFVKGSVVPLFSCQDDNSNEYTSAEAAVIHDNALAWVFATFGGDEATLRSRLMSRLNLVKGQRVLITGVGAGNDLPFLSEQVGNEGQIVALDYAKQMLMSAVDRVQSLYGLSDHNIEFCVCDATKLPFATGYFDAAYHFGGINLFSSVSKGISEMDRVVKAGGRVVLCDEGLAPWLKNTPLGAMLINNNPLYAFEAPLADIPATAVDVNLSWEVADCFYVIDFTVAKSAKLINLDIPHKGVRGGTIRTRFEGKLEGVDPQLKAQLYEEAKNRGISRVALLESLLIAGLTAQSSDEQ